MGNYGSVNVPGVSGPELEAVRQQRVGEGKRRA